MAFVETIRTIYVRGRHSARRQTHIVVLFYQGIAEIVIAIRTTARPAKYSTFPENLQPVEIIILIRYSAYFQKHLSTPFRKYGNVF
jgi:hypothetical protein